jgi:rSAM/selenodomain-associated transferase 2
MPARMVEPIDQHSSIAVLVPTLNEANRIAALLHRLRHSGFAEIIVADGGSRDATVAIASSIPGVICIDAPRGRGHQLAAAVAASSAPILLMLHADTLLPDNAAATIHSALSDRSCAGGCFRLVFDSPSPSLAVYAWFSRFDTGLTTFGDQAFFMRRTALDAAGGVPPWDLLEDVELRRRLKSVGPFVKLPAQVVTSARRFTARGKVRTQARNLIVMVGFYLGVPIKLLAQLYRSQTNYD